MDHSYCNCNYCALQLVTGLPDGDGFDVIREFHERFPAAAAIACSGYGTSDDVAASLQHGFNAHVVKVCNCI